MAVQAGAGAGKVGLSYQVGRIKAARFFYDFAVEGGAVGAITLRGETIPAGSLVLATYVDVNTVVTSGGAATVSLDIEAAADVRAAATLATAPALSTATPKEALNTIRTTAVRSVVATVGTAALTAGKFSVVVTYVELA
ncbi:hypothetical protein [Streptomyces sp. NPDC059009]|uniref:hypothetical protein n=1 Tax=Streptomyces sp. NPDC059009 TaxID=3346694 RepID=UPI0036A476B8